MRILERGFTTREKYMLAILAFCLAGLLYFKFIDQPVREYNDIYDAKIAELENEKSKADAKVKELQSMENEIDRLKADKRLGSYMPSYNAEKQEVSFLNATLSSATDYYIGFQDVKRDGDQVRRNFSLQYTVPTYNAAVDILRALEQSNTRCLISDLAMVPNTESVGDLMSDPVQVSCSATFYETMKGGEADKQLVDENSEE